MLKKNAFNICFKGLPGTDLNIPLIENENDASSVFKLFKSSLMKEQDLHYDVINESSNLIRLEGIKRLL
jgi:hypothetical protein